MNPNTEAYLAFLDRDWDAIAAMKARTWREQKKRMTTRELFALMDGFRVHTKSIRPDWPSEAERREDFEHHVRLHNLLRNEG